jgi:hypothetical protein
MFMLTAMQNRRKADSEPVDAEIEHAESDTRDEKPSSNEAQADGP